MSHFWHNCYCCCFYCSTKYKRLVNNVYPRKPSEGLSKNDLTKLCFYVITEPQKIDRVFSYISSRTFHFIRHRKRAYVKLSIEMMNEIMTVTSAQVNLFVDVYLKTIQRLLEETGDKEMLLTALNSFEMFCNIKEESASYPHRNYQFFVDRFSSMCHYVNPNPVQQNELRCLGLRGLQAVIRKLANDELHNKLWNQMNKIIPSLLFNVQEGFKLQKSLENKSEKKFLSSVDCTSSIAIAESVLKDLFSRVRSGHLKDCFNPVLTHFDNHALWNPPDLAVYVYKIIMGAVHSANICYSIVSMILAHVEKHLYESDQTKTSIMKACHQCIIFASRIYEPGEFFGSSLYTNLSRLLQYLKLSFEIQNINPDMDDESDFQSAVIDTISDFTLSFPSFQIAESMMFVLNYIPKEKVSVENKETTSTVLQKILFKTLYKILLTSQSNLGTVSFTHMLPSLSLFDPLITFMKSVDPEIRSIVMNIMCVLFDKHNNLPKIQTLMLSIAPHAVVTDFDLNVKSLEMKIEDREVLRKFGSSLSSALLNNLLYVNNECSNFQSIFSLMTVLLIEYSHENMFVVMLHVCLTAQSDVIESPITYPFHILCAIHGFLAAFFAFISKITMIPRFCTHVDTVIEQRRKEAPFLLPDSAFQQFVKLKGENIKKELFFNKDLIKKSLEQSGYDVSNLDAGMEFFRSKEETPVSPNKHKTSSGGGGGENVFPESGKTVQQSSPSDVHSKRISFNSFRDIIRDDSNAVNGSGAADGEKHQMRELINEKQTELEIMVNNFKEKSFHELMELTSSISKKNRYKNIRMDKNFLEDESTALSLLSNDYSSYSRKSNASDKMITRYFAF